MATALIDTLHRKLRVFLEHRLFTLTISTLIFLNPAALAPQVWTVFTASSVEGISLTTWIFTATIQTAVIFEGIRVRSAPMFYSMLVSVCMSTTIIIVVLVRG
ncbi:MAG: hypothetical protein HYT29_00970 [Parcubacteria group bacterium]|nr:hypothetical protein [Parcubacteria group bacterium]